jgi:hypothetical protein
MVPAALVAPAAPVSAVAVCAAAALSAAASPCWFPAHAAADRAAAAETIVQVVRTLPRYVVGDDGGI